MIEGKIAVITGANRGIGLSTVELFSEQGASVWACSRKKSDEFESKLQDISARTGNMINPVYFDVADDKAVKDAFRFLGKELSRIDILVNNAGMSVEKLFQMTAYDELNDSMKTNWLAGIRLSQIVSRYMIKQKCGSIVNVASVSGMIREKGSTAYGSSKAAVIFATKTMSLELGEYGIRVNSVSPGFIATDMWENRDEGIKDKILDETPLKRQGTPREVAGVILFLASDYASYITGQNIVVDGGRRGGLMIEGGVFN